VQRGLRIDAGLTPLQGSAAPLTWGRAALPAVERLRSPPRVAKIPPLRALRSPEAATCRSRRVPRCHQQRHDCGRQRASRIRRWTQRQLHHQRQWRYHRSDRVQPNLVPSPQGRSTTSSSAAACRQGRRTVGSCARRFHRRPSRRQHRPA
jgi:hypothetical protein